MPSNKIKLGTSKLIVLKNKVLFSKNGRKSHHTLHLGPNSGVIDIHITGRTKGKERHKRIFSITHDQLGKLLLNLPLTPYLNFWRKFRILDRTWFLLHKMTAIIVDYGYMTPDKLSSMDMLSPSQETIENMFREVDGFDDLFDLGEKEYFILVSLMNPRKPKRVGFGYSIRRINKAILIWTKDTHMETYIREMRSNIEKALIQHINSD